jgi:hypothetical protein
LCSERPAVSTIHAADHDRSPWIRTLEDEYDFSADLSSMQILGGASGYRGVAELPGEYHERRPTLVIKSNEYANDGTVQRRGRELRDPSFRRDLFRLRVNFHLAHVQSPLSSA